MAEVSGAWEIYSSNKQDSRSVDTSLGRKLSPPPEHLSQVLYIPRHDERTSYFRIHDITARYAAATKDYVIGSSQYLVALGVMPKPQDAGTDAVAYDVSPGTNQSEEIEVKSARTTTYSPALGQIEVKVVIAPTEDKAGSLIVQSPKVSTLSTQEEEIPISVSYPIPPSQTRDGVFKHPYFTLSFKVPAGNGKGNMQSFEWQVHPTEHGRLRYTLVRLPGSEAETRANNADPHICAIYHHIGVGASLALPYSEGILLTPSIDESGIEPLVVASTLGMLWRLRKLHVAAPGKKTPLKKKVGGGKDSKGKLASSFKNLIGRKG